MSNAVQLLDSYKIEVIRNITIGAQYYLAPSEAFLGIECGNVTIDAILHPDINMDEITKRDSVDMWLDSVDDDDDIDNNDLAIHYKTCLYVQYTYYTQSEGTAFMPIDIFAAHCVPRY